MDGEVLVVLLIVFGLLSALLVLPIVALVMLRGLRRAVDGLQRSYQELTAELKAVRPPPAPAAPAAALRERAAVPPTPPPSVTPPVAVRPPPHPAVPPPPMRPAPPAEPSRAGQLAASAREALGRVWYWILFGEERRPENVTVEYALATTWLPRLGVLILVLGIGFFLRWSSQRGLIGPAGRVAIGMTAGLGLLGWGLRLIGRKFHLIGQGFLGGGLLALYFCAYAAGPLYRLVTTPGAFALMVLVTVAAGVLSARTNSPLTAILGLAGGYLTPIVIRTPSPNLPALYAYILLLGMGIFRAGKGIPDAGVGPAELCLPLARPAHRQSLPADARPGPVWGGLLPAVVHGHAAPFHRARGGRGDARRLLGPDGRPPVDLRHLARLRGRRLLPAAPKPGAARRPRRAPRG